MLPDPFKYVCVRRVGLWGRSFIRRLLQRPWLQELGGVSVFAIGVLRHALDSLLLEPPHSHGFLSPYSGCPDRERTPATVSRLHPVRHHDVREDSIPNDD